MSADYVVCAAFVVSACHSGAADVVSAEVAVDVSLCVLAVYSAGVVCAPEVGVPVVTYLSAAGVAWFVLLS